MRVLSSQEAFQYTTNLFPWYLSASINELAPERVRDYKATGVSGSTPMIDTSPPYEKDTFVPSLQYRDDVVSLASSGSVVINLSYAFTYRGSARHDAHPYFSNYWQRPALYWISYSTISMYHIIKPVTSTWNGMWIFGSMDAYVSVVPAFQGSFPLSTPYPHQQNYRIAPSGHIVYASIDTSSPPIYSDPQRPALSI